MFIKVILNLIFYDLDDQHSPILSSQYWIQACFEG